MRRLPGVLLPALAWLLAAPGAAQAHDVKDPVCRMTTDTDTTPYREQVGGKTFYFCSAACQSRFDKQPARYSALAASLQGRPPRRYRLELRTGPRPAARRLLPLALAVRDSDTGAPVTRFERIHERLLHLVLVRDDLSWFEHQHPWLGPDGLFRLAWAFPRPGRYWLFADFTPADGDNQIRRVALTLPGPAPRAPAPLPDSPGEDGLYARAAGPYRATLRVIPAALRAGRQALLTYTLRERDGRPVTDAQPFLGTMGHLFAVSADGSHAVHTHPLHGVAPGSYAAAMLGVMQAGHALVVTPGMVSESGPTFTFKLTLPAPGVYRLWAQFLRHNRVVTVPFTVRVAPPDGAPVR